ncbi:MAG: hypothetical protein LC126_01240 [Bryobacterales bacterium]|nr:hypothetical protein [Bryobacterales bacterium]
MMTLPEYRARAVNTAAGHENRILLGLANEILVRNFHLPAWLHTSSEVCRYRAIHSTETVRVTGRIRDAFARKGHEFLIAGVTVSGNDRHLALHAVHAAIWRPRSKQ